VLFVALSMLVPPTMPIDSLNGAATPAPVTVNGSRVVPSRFVRLGQRRGDLKAGTLTQGGDGTGDEP